MTELVEYLVRSLVDDAEGITVAESGENIVVSVPKSDMGKVIGKQGRTAKAIRTLVKAAAAKKGRKCSVEIAEIE